ncbi:MAG: DUF4878 domain-containing protein [Methanomicrobium sp.]|nr:DUF4878 domain-containing protein [Methanomicrobium sp.]
MFILSSGCTSSSGSSDYSNKNTATITFTPTPTLTPTPTPILPATPEEIFVEYYFACKQLDEDKIWNLLSESAKSTKDKNQIYNTMYALYSDGTSLSSYEIVDLQTEGDSATLNVKINSKVQGYKLTHDNTIPLVRENEDWKINKFVILI